MTTLLKPSRQALRLQQALLTITLVACLSSSDAAQTVDRAQLLQEIGALQTQINATSDPAQKAALQEQLEIKEAAYLAPASADFATHAAFLRQPDTGLIRLMPRGQVEPLLSTRGGGAYYSFTRLTHAYGFGSDLELQQGRFSVGFAGVDFGFLVALGNVGLETVGLDHPGVRYLANFAAPLIEAEARTQHQRSGAGFQENGFTYRNRLDAILNTTYVVRSVQYGLADALIAFRFVRQDSDGSVILLWRLLQWFSTPQLDTADYLTTVSAATYRRAPLAPGAIVAAFGSKLSATTAVATSLPLPITLGDISVTIFDRKGVAHRAPLFAVTPTQINFQVPPGTALGPIDLNVDNSATGTRRRETLAAVSVAPGIFTANANGIGPPAGVFARVRIDGLPFYEPLAEYDEQSQRFVCVPLALPAPDEQLILVLFGTGLRGRSELARVEVTIDGLPAPALFAGALTDFIGLDQLNVLMPRNLTARGEVEVKVTVDGRVANTSIICIE